MGLRAATSASVAAFRRAYPAALRVAGERPAAACCRTRCSRHGRFRRRDQAVQAWLLSIVRRRFIDLATAAARPQVSGRCRASAPDEGRHSRGCGSAQLVFQYRELQYGYVEGLDSREIGQVLGITPRQATKRLSRARIALRDILPKGGQQALKAGEAEVSPERGG
jgi:hypothetical protein